MREIAEGVLMGGKPRIRGNVDAPAQDILALMIARRQPQYLNDAGRRRVVAINMAMTNADAHVAVRCQCHLISRRKE